MYYFGGISPLFPSEEVFPLENIPSILKKSKRKRVTDKSPTPTYYRSPRKQTLYDPNTEILVYRQPPPYIFPPPYERYQLPQNKSPSYIFSNISPTAYMTMS